MESSWVRAVNAIIRGESNRYRGVKIGRTSDLLREYGLGPHDLIMSAAKVARARKDHPEVALETWYQLPELLNDPKAIFPSARADGSIVIVIAVEDSDHNPVIVPVIASEESHSNAVLSVYGKIDGHAWIVRQIAMARDAGLSVYQKSGSADPEPKPESADAISWSPDPISVDRSTEPKRQILSLTKKSTSS